MLLNSLYSSYYFKADAIKDQTIVIKRYNSLFLLLKIQAWENSFWHPLFLLPILAD